MKYYLFFYGENRKKEIILETEILREIDEVTSTCKNSVELARKYNLWDCTEFGINSVDENNQIEDVDIYYQEKVEEVKNTIYNQYSKGRTEKEKYNLSYWLNLKTAFEIRQLDYIKKYNEKAFTKVKKLA